MGNSSFPPNVLPGAETQKSRKQILPLKTKGEEHGLSFVTVSPVQQWRYAFLCLSFAVSAPLERCFAFHIHCEWQLQLHFRFPSFIPKCLGSASLFFLGHLILLLHPVRFLLCLESVSSSEFIHDCMFSSTSGLLWIEKTVL